MMVTTIQLSHNVKDSLNRMKETRKESYEKVILNLINIAEEQRRGQRELLIEGYKEMAGESLKIVKEFEAIEEDFDWEW